jgi:hypothetical protein
MKEDAFSTERLFASAGTGAAVYGGLSLAGYAADKAGMPLPSSWKRGPA